MKNLFFFISLGVFTKSLAHDKNQARNIQVLNSNCIFFAVLVTHQATKLIFQLGVENINHILDVLTNFVPKFLAQERFKNSLL